MTMDKRESLIHAARVYIAQSHHFTRLHRGFSFVILEWAANCRRRAMSINTTPVQGDFFGGAA